MTAFSTPWLVTLFCVWMRLGIVILFAPIEAIRQLPFIARFMLTFTLSLLLLTWIPLVHASSWMQLFQIIVAEGLNGLMILLGIHAAFAIFQVAGQLIDSQMGLNAMAIFNPVENIQEPFTGRLLTLLAVYLFFAENYHHILFRALKQSFITHQPGQLPIVKNITALPEMGSLFALSLLLATPILTALLVTDICGALLIRSLPQMNIWLVLLPVKILSGLFFLSITLKGMQPIIQHIFQMLGEVTS